MAVKLWTTHFIRICIANMLLFISMYMLFPILSVEMADRLGVPVAQTGAMFLFFTLGMFIIGPFHAYLIDAYRRKSVYIFFFVLLLAASIGYRFVTNITELICLSIIQGLAFGMATTAGITLGIDITGTTLRSAGNVSFAWIARFGMIVGISLGIWLNHYYAFKDMLTISVIIGALGILFVAGVYVPFRAPMVTKLFSFDRFLLLRGWIPVINIILITFIPGLLIPVLHPFLNDFVIGGFPIPFFVGVGLGYLLSIFLVKLLKLRDKIMRTAFIGIIAELLAIYFLNVGYSPIAASLLLGLGLGLVMPQFLAMFVKLSHHCQRGTANTTHLFAIEIGISLGIAYACYTDMETMEMLNMGQTVALIALLFYILITYPYYIKMRVRGK